MPMNMRGRGQGSGVRDHDVGRRRWKRRGGRKRRERDRQVRAVGAWEEGTGSDGGGGEGGRGGRGMGRVRWWRQRWLCPKAINILDTLFRNSDRPSARDVEEVHISWRVLTKKAECVPTTYRVFCHIARTSSLYAGIITWVGGGGGVGGEWDGGVGGDRTGGWGVGWGGGREGVEGEAGCTLSR